MLNYELGMMNYQKIDIIDRTFQFGVKIIELINSFSKTSAGFSISSQIVRSGTSIGANVQEAQSASSKKDFIHRLNIALREARETKYWLEMAEASNLTKDNAATLITENEEIIKILCAIIKNTKAKIHNS